MLRLFSASVRTTALCSMMLSCIAFAQRPVRPAPVLPNAKKTKPVQQRYKTPADMLMIPYLKAHLKATTGSVTGANVARPNDAGDVVTPNFAGYVNAPTFPARNTASLATDIFDTGVSVQIEADFNKDGKPDIAVLQEEGTLNILLGDGAGKLSAPVSYLNPNQETSNVLVAYAADINGDGNPDVVAYDYVNNAMITWLNLGSGTFNAAVTTPLDITYGYAGIVYVADLNGDGKADIVYDTTISQSNTSTTLELETQLGAGDGTFGKASAAIVQQLILPYSVSLPQVAGIAMADLNGDGKLDLALGLPENSGGSGNWLVATMLGNGDGSFSTFGATSAMAPPAVAGIRNVSFNSTGIFLADVNGDGKLDVVSDLDGTVYTAPGNGDGTFGTAVASVVTVSDAGSSVLVDVNSDGKLDWVTAGGTMAVMLGNGDGTFADTTASSQFIIDPAGYYSMAVADFNGDGVQDIAQLGADYKQVSLFFGSSSGLHGAPVVTVADQIATNSYLATSGSYTASGYQSPVEFYSNYATNVFNVYTAVNDGKGNFKSVQTLAGGLPSDLEYFEPFHADFNGDGLEDLAYANITGDVLVALSNGDGTFGTPKAIGLGTQVCPEYYAAAGDINGDGKADIVVPYGSDISCGYLSGGSSGYWVALGNGDGTFAKPVFTTFGTELYSATLADMNGDGVLDLLLNDVPFINGFGFQLSYLPGNGDGTFGNASVIESSYVLSNVATADINGDGKTDLVLGAEEVAGSDITTGGIVTITGNGDGTFNPPSMIASGNFFYGLQVADMNNDGKSDIVATLYETLGQPKTYYGMVTLLGYGNGQFAEPYNQLESLGSTLPQVGKFYADGAVDVMTSTGYGPALFISQGGSSLALASSASAINFGDEETLTATVSAILGGRPAATGSVTFYDGTTVLGTEALSSGQATFATSVLAVGTHSIKAVYSGDSNYNPATAAATSVTVATLAPAFALTGTPATVSVTGGSQGIVTLGLTANQAFSGAVTLTCSGMPANGTCSVNPGSVTLAAGGASTATLVIGTTGTHAELQHAPSPWQGPATGLSLAAMVGLFVGRRKRIRMISALGLAVLLSACGMLMGCGSSGNSKSTSAVTVTPGNYTITVTATPTSGSTAAVQTASVSLTVN